MAPEPRTPPHARRNQAERSATTRAALLDATLECLVCDGYANTTTARVAERAGLSRGAHLHHFQTRAALLAAAADHLTRRRGEHMLASADALPTGPERVAEGLDLLWRSYNTPLYQASLDLWTHARTDDDLRDHLIPIERRLDRQTMELSRRLFPHAARRADFEVLVNLALATIRGLVVLDTLHTGSARAEKQWGACRAQLVSLFEPEGRPGMGGRGAAS
ncbi:TetR/AcrR family transcriptional regulator [Baekduia soli]|uniref:TetR/AcrR family transcriptional regulator n=1 Tax=Baekduia soli TaxID=496014 RepID=A0A5B8U096_9ACTN|nr:TetR/AcrR family transcriptional regulator [Baekduia soli]QEC46419.1 TetR/AcrR family transcriptional regulator [Baekduia soli]